jgi:hypothetical protein
MGEWVTESLADECVDVAVAVALSLALALGLALVLDVVPGSGAPGVG